MNTQYRLPCPCGSHVLVDPRQAGQTVRCSCGRALDVPTMRALSGLEPVALAQEATKPPLVWGARYRVLLVGLVIVLLSAAALLYFGIWTKPEVPAWVANADNIQRDAQRLTLLECYALWERLQFEGLAREHPGLARYREDVLAYRIRTGVTSIFFLLGVLTLLGALFIPKPAAPSE